MSSVLKLQNLEPTTANTSAAVVSLTSSSSSCCSTKPEAV
ncbi:class III lanthipeptide [Streptomyces fradiae]